MGPGGPTLRSSPVRRFLLFSESAEKSILTYELIPLETSVSILPKVFQYLFRTAMGLSPACRVRYDGFYLFVSFAKKQVNYAVYLIEN